MLLSTPTNVILEVDAPWVSKTEPVMSKKEIIMGGENSISRYNRDWIVITHDNQGITKVSYIRRNTIEEFNFGDKDEEDGKFSLELVTSNYEYIIKINDPEKVVSLIIEDI